MKRRPPIALLTLNAALLGTLAFVTFAPGAEAQQAARSRGRYGIIGGWIQNCDPEIAYIIDETNQEVVAVYWDERVKKFTGLGYRNLASEIASFSANR
ncbi:MAG: hypothetical protein EBU31_14345 [Proteobacteria bacterium]|nr:hypothetical protein [Pseudomonadota bacterium]